MRHVLGSTTMMKLEVSHLIIFQIYYVTKDAQLHNHYCKPPATYEYKVGLYRGTIVSANDLTLVVRSLISQCQLNFCPGKASMDPLIH